MSVRKAGRVLSGQVNVISSRLFIQSAMFDGELEWMVGEGDRER